MAKQADKRFCIDGATHNFDIVEVTPLQFDTKTVPRKIKLYCRKCAEIREVK